MNGNVIQRFDRISKYIYITGYAEIDNKKIYCIENIKDNSCAFMECVEDNDYLMLTKIKDDNVFNKALELFNKYNIKNIKVDYKL